MDKKHETNKQIKKFNATKKKYNHPEILDKILKHYGHDKFITVNKTDGAMINMIDINTPFIDNMHDSIVLSLIAPSKNTVFIMDNAETSFNLEGVADSFSKFLNDSEIKGCLKLYNIKYDAKQDTLYTPFNFRKSYYNALKFNKGDKDNATRDMWFSFDDALSGFINGLLSIYTMADLVFDQKYKLDDK